MSTFIVTNCNGNSVNKCASILRIKHILEKYQSIKHIQKICLKQFNVNEILNDYNHIIIDHYQHNSHRHQFEQINDFLSSNLNCNASNCSMITRTHRIRQQNDYHNEKERENDDDNLESLITDNNILFLIDTLDSIHTHLIHAYDLGLKLRDKEMRSISNNTELLHKQVSSVTDDDIELDQEDIMTQTRDTLLPQIKDTLNSHRLKSRDRNNDNDNGLHRIAHSNKSCHNLFSLVSNHNTLK